MKGSHIAQLSRLLNRSLNLNQVLILSAVEKRKDRVTRILAELSERYGVPYSTLKFNAKVLKELELLEYGTAVDPVDVRLTDVGRLVLDILREGVGEREAYTLNLARVGAHRYEA